MSPQGKKRQYDQEVENLERQQKQTIERLEQEHTNRLRDEAKRIKAEQDKELSKYQNMLKNRKKEVSPVCGPHHTPHLAFLVGLGTSSGFRRAILDRERLFIVVCLIVGQICVSQLSFCLGLYKRCLDTWGLNQSLATCHDFLHRTELSTAYVSLYLHLLPMAS